MILKLEENISQKELEVLVKYASMSEEVEHLIIGDGSCVSKSVPLYRKSVLTITVFLLHQGRNVPDFFHQKDRQEVC